MAVGQLFSQRFSYGVHALAFVAKKPMGELTTLPELAAWMRTIWPAASEAYLSNIVQRLARGKLLRSHRGITGGYSLGREADKITVRDVVELLEGIEINRCGLSLEDQCPAEGRCRIQRRLTDLEAKFLESLDQVAIRDMVDDIEVLAPQPPGEQPAEEPAGEKQSVEEQSVKEPPAEEKPS